MSLRPVLAVGLADLAARLAPHVTPASIGAAPASRFLTGTGSPEGVVAAPIGTTYTDTAATAGAVEWTKWTGTGNTGWRVTKGDTGWRWAVRWAVDGTAIDGPVLPSGWKSRSIPGGVCVRRIGNHVHVQVTQVEVAIATSIDPLWGDQQVGFRPSPRVTDRVATLYTSASTYRVWMMNPSKLTRGSGAATSVGEFINQIEISYITDDPWPTTLPGAPAA